MFTDDPVYVHLLQDKTHFWETLEVALYLEQANMFLVSMKLGKTTHIYTGDTQCYYTCLYIPRAVLATTWLAGLFEENLNASRPFEHPPVRGKNVKAFS